MLKELECSEWMLPLFGAGTVLALAKHINPHTISSITYYDIACTINRGEDTTEGQHAALLLSACSANGGQLTVTVNTSDLTYSSPKYIASKAKLADIIIKLVRDPNFV